MALSLALTTALRIRLSKWRVSERICSSRGRFDRYVATGDNGSYRSLPRFARQNRRDGDRSGRLAGELRPRVEEPERLLDLRLGDEHALHIVGLPMTASASLARERPREPVCDPVRRPPARSVRLRARSCTAVDRSGSTAITAGRAAQPDPGGAASPPAGTTIVAVSGASSSSSSASVARACDHEGIVEGMRERPAGLGDVLVEPVERPRGRRFRSSSAPYPRVASASAGLALAYMTTRQSIPSAAAPQASACAWLPAEIPITPRAFSSAVRGTPAC